MGKKKVALVEKASKSLPVDATNREALREGKYSFGKSNQPFEIQPVDETHVATVLNNRPLLKGDAFISRFLFGYKEKDDDTSLKVGRRNKIWNVKQQKFEAQNVPNCYMFVLNLEHRTDRAIDTLTSFASAAGNDFEKDDAFMSPAVEGKFITDEEFATSGFKNNMRELRKKKNAFGCFMAHFITILSAYASNMFPAVIFEDDLAIPKGKTMDDLERAVSTIPDGTVLAYLGALPVKDKKRYAMPAQPTGWIPVPEGVQLYATHAYVIPTAAAAETILDWLLSNKTTVDSSYVKFHKTHRGQVKVLNPFLFYQGESYSDIEGVKRGVRGSGRPDGQSVADDLRNVPVGAPVNHPDLVE